MIIPYCLEVESQLAIPIDNSYKNNINDSFVIPLNNAGLPIDHENDLEQIDNYQNLGNVFARIIFKIPSFAR